MSSIKLIDTKRPQEKAILVGVELYNENELLPLEDSMQELELLADAAGS